MAKLIKDRSVLKPRAYYSVETDRGYIVGSVDLKPGRVWQVRLRNHITKKMEDDLIFLTFAGAKSYALEDAARWEAA